MQRAKASMMLVSEFSVFGNTDLLAYGAAVCMNASSLEPDLNVT
jgi:hypothetical protein